MQIYWHCNRKLIVSEFFIAIKIHSIIIFDHHLFTERENIRIFYLYRSVFQSNGIFFLPPRNFLFQRTCIFISTKCFSISFLIQHAHRITIVLICSCASGINVLTHAERMVDDILQIQRQRVEQTQNVRRQIFKKPFAHVIKVSQVIQSMDAIKVQ